MGEEEAATLDGQFFAFSRLFDTKRTGTTINLFRSDYWMRQAMVLDDRKITMTDTGIHFFKFEKSEIDYEEWLEFLGDLCKDKDQDEELMKEILTNCGLPGQSPVEIPEYREFFKSFKPRRVVYCNATFDSFLCWPPTPGGENTTQNCPVARLSDTTRHAFRLCGDNGLWLGRRANESDHRGWTNYTPCFPTEVQKLLVKVNDDENSQSKMEIALRTRYMEIVGFSISLIALLISLTIFTRFKTLRNTRTNIHRNLFSAMMIQVIIRLIVYIDQAIIRDKPGMNVKGIDNMPYICEVSYILLEYAISAMFMWMFVEGLFLHNVVTANVLRGRTSMALFLGIGWGLPVLVTALWAAITAVHYEKDQVIGCWYGYNFLMEYWLLQAPRLAVILINLLFLLNIMRVLITKLNATENNEMTKVKKAARAALVLLPLLGITNILNMIEPVDGAVWKFALWCYVTHFLRSFQGFFIALIYCFMNGEVNEVVGKNYRDRLEERRDAERRLERNMATRAIRNSWWRSCLVNWVVIPMRRATMWIRSFFPQKAVQNEDIPMETSEEIRQRNYRDPEFLSGMEEIRLENDILVTGSI